MSRPAIGGAVAFAVVNCHGAEVNRFAYPEMAAAVAKRYGEADPMMRAWAPYTVREVEREAPVIVPGGCAVNGRERWASEAVTFALWRRELIREVNADLKRQSPRYTVGELGRMIGAHEASIVERANAIIHAAGGAP